MENIQKLISEMIDKKIKTAEVFKHIRGKIISVDEDNEFAVVDVQGKPVTLVNKTGEELNAGDEVTVHYWTNISNGYIALTNGVSKTKLGSLYIDKAVVMTENQAETYTYAAEIIDVDVENSVKVKYGNGRNTIIVGGNPVLISEYTNTTDFNEFYEYANSIEDNLLSAEIVMSLQDDLSVENITYSVSLSGVYQNDGWTWMPSIISRSNSGVVKNVIGNSYTPDDSIEYFTELSKVGIGIVCSQINAPNTDSPYGSAECRLFLAAKGNGRDSGYFVRASRPTSSTYRFLFADEAEYNYAITTMSKSEIRPSSS